MNLSRYRSQIVLLTDVGLIFLCNFALFLPALLAEDIRLLNLVLHIGLLTACVLVFQLLFRTYESLWRYAESREYLVLLSGMSLGFALYTVCNLVMDTKRIWITQALTGTSLALLAMLVVRFTYRLYRTKTANHRREGGRYAAIIGAGTAGVALLDEATSALDAATERKVLKNIVKQQPNKTCIVTTHRTSVLSLCDRVYRVVNTRVTELDEEESGRISMDF